jgi:hypothetical protein
MLNPNKKSVPVQEMFGRSNVLSSGGASSRNSGVQEGTTLREVTTALTRTPREMSVERPIL